MKGFIRPRGPGKWEVIHDDGKHPDGRRRQKSVTVYADNEREAQVELRRVLSAVDNGPRSSERPTVAKFLSHWLTSYAKSRVSAKTFERYQSIVDKHLSPALGNIELHKLRPDDIQETYTDWLKGGRLDKRAGGLSAKTIVQHHRVLRHALKTAERWGSVARNVADLVTPPKITRKAARFLLEAEWTKLLKQAAAGRSLYAPVLLMLHCGLRRGELLALHWADVDFDARTIAVRFSLEKTKASGIALKAPKNERTRVTPIGSMVAQALRAHKAQQNEPRLKKGPSYKNRDLVFADLDGSYLDPDAFTSSFRKLLEDAGLEDMGTHALRHTCATLLLAQDINPKIVAERLGHSTIQLTLDTYSHLLPGLQEDAADKLDMAMRKAMKGAS